jgi:hypothetical protein
MHEYRTDEQRTAAAYHIGLFLDPKQRSHFNNLGHVFLRGVDRERRWELLYIRQKGVCAACHKQRTRSQLDMNHTQGNTVKTRCDCYGQLLNDGSICNGVELICTLDPRKGGGPTSCHAKKHGREIRSDRAERRGQ